MVAKVGAKRKAKKDGKESKEDKDKDLEEEFQSSYEEVKKEVEALVRAPPPSQCHGATRKTFHEVILIASRYTGSYDSQLLN